MTKAYNALAGFVRYLKKVAVYLYLTQLNKI